ncbi:hypothetical protein AMJ85_08970 [candidate division BRC1 bacterium SM23_51]|nr:MAG: hypothetical protein AMJ85_08970 [candidate division BRC1 bacterium SM23_51]
MDKSDFATAINCIDGRVQAPVSNWIEEHFDVRYVDMITEPGAVRVMALGPLGTMRSIKQKAIVSVKGHHSSLIAVVGHHDCLAIPIPQEEHLDYIRQSVERVVSWALSVRVVGLWVNERGEIETICDTGRSDSTG